MTYLSEAVGARYLGSPLLLPSFSATLHALFEGIASGELPARTAATLTVLGKGYALGVFVAGLLALVAITNRWGGELSTCSRPCSIRCRLWRCCRSRCCGSASARRA